MPHPKMTAAAPKPKQARAPRKAADSSGGAVEALSLLTALIGDPEPPEALIAVAEKLTAKPKEVTVFQGAIRALRGSAHNLPLPPDVLRLFDELEGHVDTLEDYLESEVPDALDTWLTMTVVSPQAARITIGWYADDAGDGEPTMHAYREGVLPTECPVLAYMVIAELVDDPMYLGYDQRLN